jgi:ATP-dependent RNA helicase HelY
MIKRYYKNHKSPQRPGKTVSPKPAAPSMKPGSDKSLKPVFKKIGIPANSQFKPDPFQLEALEAAKISDCLVTAPTGAGKTWIAEQVAKDIVNRAGKVWYATPLKALTNSIYLRFTQLFGKENVGILTGDIRENQDADIVIGTTEILRNQLYDAMHTGEDLSCDMIIMDEAHYIGDEQRGVVWEEIIIYLPERISLLLLTATIGNPNMIAGWMESIRGKKCYVIENHDRPVPLFPLFFHSSGTLFPLTQNLTQNLDSEGKSALHKKVLKFADKKRSGRLSGGLPPFGDILEILHHYDLLPAIFFLKSRAECDKAIKLCHSRLLSENPEKKEALRARMEELVSKHTHLKTHRQRSWLELTATASHHSGHLPAWKTVVESLMAEGFLDAMFATSTVAAGVNFPARSVFILNSDRFNGVDFSPLSPSELQQMSGRAGRRGMDNIGFCIVMPGRYMDLNHIIKVINSPASDIESQININFSMVLNLLLSHTPEQIKMLLEKSFASYLIVSGKKKGKIARKKYGSGMELLWFDFMDHMDFLKAEDFVTEHGRLTNDGLWASKLRIDSPVLVAQTIRDELLPQHDPALLAAITASFVNEKEFNDDPLYHKALPKQLKETFLNIRKGLKPFALKMLEQGFDAPNLSVQPGLLVYHWAHDADWEEISTRYDFTEGDFARLILRTAENLRQIARLEDSFPDLAQTAERAVGLILKEPVLF